MFLPKLVNLIPWRLRGLIRNIPILKQLQAQIFERHLSGKSFTHLINAGPASGLVYPVVLPDDKLIWMGNYEQEFSETLAAAVQTCAVCYDIGGYRGFFTGVMACQGAADVQVFEPLPSNVEQIRRMAELNPSLPISVHQIAVADTVGETTFSVMPEASMGKIGESSFQLEERVEINIAVKLSTIDSMLDSGTIKPAELVKIDVEGAEAMVLRGAVTFIGESLPLMYIEAHSHALAKECVDILSPFGYAFTVLETGRAPDFITEPEVCHIEAIVR